MHLYEQYQLDFVPSISFHTYLHTLPRFVRRCGFYPTHAGFVHLEM